MENHTHNIANIDELTDALQDDERLLHQHENRLDAIEKGPTTPAPTGIHSHPLDQIPELDQRLNALLDGIDTIGKRYDHIDQMNLSLHGQLCDVRRRISALENPHFCPKD